MGMTDEQLEGYILDALDQRYPNAHKIELVQYRASMYRCEMISVTFKLDDGPNQHTEFYEP